MDMKIALTVWGNRISPVFDAARTLLLADIRNQKVSEKKYEMLNPEAPVRLVERLIELEVEILITGAISQRPASVIESGGVLLIPFICGRVSRALELCAGDSSLVLKMRMPGCRFLNGGFQDE